MEGAPELTPMEMLLARLRATDAEARRILAERHGTSKSDLPAPRPAAPIDPVVPGELPPWTAVELQLNVSEDVITFVGRDLATGRPRIKIEMAASDASPEWVPWIRRWLERRRRGTLKLV